MNTVLKLEFVSLECNKNNQQDKLVQSQAPGNAIGRRCLGRTALEYTPANYGMQHPHLEQWTQWIALPMSAGIVLYVKGPNRKTVRGGRNFPLFLASVMNDAISSVFNISKGLFLAHIIA